MIITIKEKTNTKELSEKILKPLLDIVYQYKISHAYGYIPGTKKDGWEYYDYKIKKIYSTLDSMVGLSEETYEKAKNIILEIHTFTKQFSHAEGLPKRYFKHNPNLRYYITAYKFLEDSSMQTFAELVVNKRFKYVPTYEEIQARADYFGCKYEESKELNLQYDEDDFFIEEVAKALRTVFLKDIGLRN